MTDTPTQPRLVALCTADLHDRAVLAARAHGTTLSHYVRSAVEARVADDQTAVDLLRSATPTVRGGVAR